MALASRNATVPNSRSIPPELMDALNQTYFLHLLACDPTKVMPPGKSLLSMLIHNNFQPSDGGPKDDKQAIASRVKDVAHRAFWDQALAALSSPEPSVQIPRLRKLYIDLHDALAALIPPKNSILVALSSPLPPTSSPLHSTIYLLKEILAGLRQRCAPVRDATIDALDADLANPPSPKSQPADGGPNRLAEFVLDKIKAMLALAEDMINDLNTVVLGAMTEAQLRAVLLKDVYFRERLLVCGLWGGEENVRRDLVEWMDQFTEGQSVTDAKHKWVKRLLVALGADRPVRWILPTPASKSAGSATQSSAMANGTSQTTPHPHADPEPSRLPAQLFFSEPTLAYIQNYLQAILIAAALRSLTRLPPPSSKTKSDPEHDFMERVWTLLKAEIDMEDDLNRPPRTIESEMGRTKVINLADEVVRARRRGLSSSTASPLSADEETRLRAAVERTLRITDPVFLLLSKRLLTALEPRLVEVLRDTSQTAKTTITKGPARMQTGRDLHLRDDVKERVEKRLRLMLPDESEEQDFSKQGDGIRLGAVVPGFEEEVLQRAIGDVVRRIADCAAWTKGIWGNLTMEKSLD